MKNTLLLLCCLTLLNGLLPSFGSSSLGSHRVEIVQMRFQPAELSVKKGDTVVFVNKDVVTHNVTEESGKSWKSPALASGESWIVVVSRTSDYYCSFHPMMKGKILIE
ncbi:cupredoxin domain-containing protein [Pontibacter sp. 172403-2]|uniref:plastocyanin/azurin family copper-binding protein n=1 Tax=Pontibacter rufus TaxID=2791028 RepID=UPI0018AF781D|nr:plastocyanin/azurin family copper-binding protein [Pontibacter sp. 172403-2]MBF9251671.1 cupredoxin domain-containing protein [Pontibacter sp. 172403-2]